jgi:hypothetical protein
MEPNEYLADRFFSLGVRLIREGAFPAFGIAAAQALIEDPPSLLACLGTAAGILLFEGAIAAGCLWISLLLSHDDFW